MILLLIAGKVVARGELFFTVGGHARLFRSSGSWLLTKLKTKQNTSLNIPFTPKVLLLDYWHNLSIPTSSKEMIALLFLAAKCVWAKLWKSTKVPSVKEWFVKVWDIVTANKLLEDILCKLHYNSNFIDKWYYFLRYSETLCEAMASS